jgi:hypothetical protein
MANVETRTIFCGALGLANILIELEVFMSIALVVVCVEIARQPSNPSKNNGRGCTIF